VTTQAEISTLDAHDIVYQALQELSDLEDTGLIAQYLQEQGIKGQCADPSRCAVAEYLTSKLPSNWVVSVTRYDVLVAKTIEDFYDIGTATYVDTPQMVGDFITAFDSYEFPFLLSES
jgi:hypothetical protein